MTAQDVRTHIRYSGWASGKLLAAAAALPPDALSRDLQVSHTSALQTLSHIYFADWIWYTRLVDPAETRNEHPTLEQLQQLWPALQRKWEAWSDSITDADVAHTVTYKLMNGDPGSSTVQEIVLHVVNHATLHRGQVMAMFRQLGAKPPATDLLYYQRELAAKQSA